MGGGDGGDGNNGVDALDTREISFNAKRRQQRSKKNRCSRKKPLSRATVLENYAVSTIEEKRAQAAELDWCL